MRFKKRIPKEPWSTERTQARIDEVKKSKVDLCRLICKQDKLINKIRNDKKIMSAKIGRKDIYLGQLNKQLKEQLNEDIKN